MCDWPRCLLVVLILSLDLCFACLSRCAIGFCASLLCFMFLVFHLELRFAAWPVAISFLGLLCSGTLSATRDFRDALMLFLFSCFFAVLSVRCRIAIGSRTAPSPELGAGRTRSRLCLALAVLDGPLSRGCLDLTGCFYLLLSRL